MSKTLQQSLFLFSKKVPKIKRTGHSVINGKPYSYATYDTVMEVVGPLLSRQKLYVTQTITDSTLTTTVTHYVTKESISSSITLPQGRSIQETGAAITYARRYSLSALLNLCVESDIDGTAVNSVVHEPSVQHDRSINVPVTVTISEACAKAKAMLDAATGEAKEAVIAKIKASVKLEQSEKDYLLK